MLTDCPNCGKNHRSLTVEACQDRSMSERKLQDRVLYRAKKYGWRAAHAQRATVGGTEGQEPFVITPMAVGWPDLTLAKAGHRLLFLELKRETEDVRPEQLEWLQLLNQTGARAIIVKPSDLRTGVVNVILSKGSPL